MSQITHPVGDVGRRSRSGGDEVTNVYLAVGRRVPLDFASPFVGRTSVWRTLTPFIKPVARRPLACNALLVSMTTPKALTSVRKQLGLSQEKMAQLLGVSFVSVNRWEKGHSLPLRSTVDLYEALDAALKAGRPATTLVHLATGDRRLFLMGLFNAAYEGGIDS